jgi:hypothetical protein
MRVSLPDNLNDVTLGQYQKYMLLDSEADSYVDEIFSLFTGISLDQVHNVNKKQYDEVLQQIYNALQRDGEFKQTFTIDGIDFGLIPNFDKITGGEYVDLVSSSKNIEGYNPELITLIAVLYRPIIKKDKFVNYNIEPYNGTKGHEEQISKLPMSIVNGCLGFFLTLCNELENHFQKYMEEEQVKELAV